MLIRSPIQRDRPYRQANNAAAWNGHTLPADASDVDEAIDDEMEAAEDYSAEGDYEAEAERYDRTEEDERYEEEPGWGEQQDGQQWDDDQQQQGWDEEQEEYEWHEGEEEDASAESRALVPLDAPRVTRRLFSFSRNSNAEDDEAALIPYREPGLTTPIFIGGTRQTLQSGRLGHSPLSLVARRRRPFYMHTLAIGVGLLSLLATVVALVPLGVGSHILQSLNSLANSAAPAANTIPFRPYIVHYGETLAMIADKFHVAQGGILEINNLESADQLYLGQRIKVPTNPTYGANYHALLNIPLAPLTTPSPPYGTFVIPPGFDSFAVQDYNGDPWGGSFGQCTWWAHHKRPDENLAGMGDAWAWLYAAPQRGLTVTAKPLLNATVIFEPGVEAASGIGHVAHVEQILPGGWVLISEMNFFWNGGGWGRVDYRYIQPGPGVWFIA